MLNYVDIYDITFNFSSNKYKNPFESPTHIILLNISIDFN